jgi:hypothetical protein
MPLSVCRIDRGCCRRHRPARDETLRACNAGRWHSRCRVFRMEASASHRSADRRDGTAATFARNRLLQLLMARVVPGREGGPIPGRPFSTGPAAAAEPRADNPRASTQAGRADPAPPPAASRLVPSQPGQAGLPRSLWSAQVAGIRAPDVGIRMLGYPPMELPVCAKQSVPTRTANIGSVLPTLPSKIPCGEGCRCTVAAVPHAMALPASRGNYVQPRTLSRMREPRPQTIGSFGDNLRAMYADWIECFKAVVNRWAKGRRSCALCSSTTRLHLQSLSLELPQSSCLP